MSEHKFRVGEEAFLLHHLAPTLEVTVARVTPSGRFYISGSTQCYGPDGFPWGGRYRYHGRVVPQTEENVREFWGGRARNLAEDRFRTLCATLQRIQPSAWSPQALNEASDHLQAAVHLFDTLSSKTAS